MFTISSFHYEFKSSSKLLIISSSIAHLNKYISLNFVFVIKLLFLYLIYNNKQNNSRTHGAAQSRECNTLMQLNSLACHGIANQGRVSNIVVAVLKISFRLARLAIARQSIFIKIKQENNPAFIMTVISSCTTFIFVFAEVVCQFSEIKNTIVCLLIEIIKIVWFQGQYFVWELLL